MRSDGTYCEMCGAQALARVHDVWLCAGCGLDATNGGDAEAGGGSRMIRSARRGIVAAVMGAGIVTKVLIGAVAVAAVGAVTLPLAQPDGAGPDSSSVVTAVADHQGTSVDDTLGDDAAGQPNGVEVFVNDVHAWSDCIKAAVNEHVASGAESRGGFDPHNACGEPPKYVGKDGDLPVQASENARENRQNDEAKGEAKKEEGTGRKGKGNGKPSGTAP